MRPSALLAALVLVASCHAANPAERGARCERDLLGTVRSPDYGREDLRQGRFLHGDWVTGVAGRLRVGRETTLCGEGGGACVTVDTTPLQPLDPSCDGLWVKLDGEALDPARPRLRAYAIAPSAMADPPAPRARPDHDGCAVGSTAPDAREVSLDAIDASLVGKVVRARARLWTRHVEGYRLFDPERHASIAFEGERFFPEECSHVRVIAEGVVVASPQTTRAKGDPFFLRLTHTERAP